MRLANDFSLRPVGRFGHELAPSEPNVVRKALSAIALRLK